MAAILLAVSDEAFPWNFIIESGEELAPCYFADNNLIAVGAMKALKAKGFRIPEDISLVGFDNIPFSGIIEPGLTTVHMPKKEMGRPPQDALLKFWRPAGTCP